MTSLRMKKRNTPQTSRKSGTMQVINLVNSGCVMFVQGDVVCEAYRSHQKVDTENQVLDQIEHYASRCDKFS